eukprot:gnl/TRDRNA2_/TRDRNA2_44622_c0_seq1.p1 gnl/TRDRNA2_/TRDRNA2_44622_c0~~gnl/TRDRNA2_/TRDRNA2_44622_c0_seq1.p1  ORF type:complete len:163 (+),score=15.90 gnl/TRDRNA2_/TRDRNA2_44622_c0_seq1:67-555(+)
MSRSVSVLALPPQHYGQPKGHFWKGTQSMTRFPPMRPGTPEIFDEYLNHATMNPSYHEKRLSTSSGLMEMHYDTMRKMQKHRAKIGEQFFKTLDGPTMDRQFHATTGYSGHIPGKESNNVCGCTFARGSQMAMTLHPPHQSTGRPWASLGHSRSSPSLTQTF